MEGCDSDLVHVKIGGGKPPTCETIPVGVRPSSSVSTIETFDLEEGYYRVSNESSIVLQCYQEEACVGGTNASNYCATGYRGPCESSDRSYDTSIFHIFPYLFRVNRAP